VHISTTGDPEAKKFWGRTLLAHCLHESFIFEDNAVKLFIGFSCQCSGKKQSWTTTLSNLKGLPVEVHTLVMALREREKDPTGTWYLYQQKRQTELAKEYAWREVIHSKIVSLEHKLRKRLNTSRRKKLKKQRQMLTRMLRDDTVARSTKLYKQIVLNETD